MRILKKIKNKLKYPVVLFGFTDKVPQLMAVSDLMITKAGGISTTEAVNMKLPMVLYGSIPGQETWNENMLVSHGAAEKADKVKSIPGIVDRILSSDEVYGTFREGLKLVRKSDAAKCIVDTVMSEIDA